MRVAAWALLVLSASTFLAMFASWMLGIWTGDDRWGVTGVMLMVPFVATAALGGATLATADD